MHVRAADLPVQRNGAHLMRQHRIIARRDDNRVRGHIGIVSEPYNRSNSLCANRIDLGQMIVRKHM
ncbi:hypothetical protein D3C84_997870 [compost metagenome]